jgi:hypothetical protein
VWSRPTNRERQRRAEFAQTPSQLRTAQSGYPHVEEDAAEHSIARRSLIWRNSASYSASFAASAAGRHP